MSWSGENPGIRGTKHSMLQEHGQPESSPGFQRRNAMKGKNIPFGINLMDFYRVAGSPHQTNLESTTISLQYIIGRIQYIIARRKKNDIQRFTKVWEGYEENRKR